MDDILGDLNQALAKPRLSAASEVRRRPVRSVWSESCLTSDDPLILSLVEVAYETYGELSPQTQRTRSSYATP